MKRAFFLLLVFLMLLTAAIWGLSFVVVKDSLNRIGPIWMLAYRFSIAAIGLSLIQLPKLLKGRKKNIDNTHLLPSHPHRVILHGALLGVFLFSAYVLQTYGCMYTTAGKNAFFTAIYVFLVPIISCLILRKRLKVRVLFCAALSVVGLALLSLGGGPQSAFNKGDFLTILCSILFALHIAYGGKWAVKDDPITLSILQFIVAAILGILLAPLLDGAGRGTLTQLLDARVIKAMLYLGIFSTMVGFALQNIGLKYLPANVAALILSTESVFGALFGVLILSEPLTAIMATGGALMFLALVLAQL